MMEKAGTDKKIIITFILIVSIQIVFITYLFGWKKDGYHVDEIWQYSIANGSDGYGILFDSARYDGLRNMNTWIGSDKFIELLTVQKDEAFRLENVWINAENDTKGPLGYVLLHYICSLTPDHFSKWQMYVVNIISFIIIQIFLFKFGYAVTRSNFESLLICIFYGFCHAGVNTVVFLRMYAFETAITMMYVYFWSLFYVLFARREEKPLKGIFKYYVVNTVLVALGALTDYIFLMLAFLFTLCLCVYLLFKKKIRHSLMYGLSSALGVILFFFLFPGFKTHIMGLSGSAEVWGKTLSMDFSLRVYRAMLAYDFLGMEVSIYKTMTGFYAFWVAVGIAVIFLIIIFLERKRIDFKKWGENTATYLRTLSDCFRGRGYIYLVCLLSIFAIIIMTSLKINIRNMGIFSDRYLMIAFPMICFMIVDITAGFLLSIQKTIPQLNDGSVYYRVATTAIIMLLICLSFLSNIQYITYGYVHDTADLKELSSGADMIYINTTVSDSAIIMEKSLDANGVYFTEIEDMQKLENNCTNGGKAVYIVIGRRDLEEFLDEQKERLGIINETKSSKKPYSQKEILKYLRSIYHSEITEEGTVKLWYGDVDVFKVEPSLQIP